jgi:hypothetical protein
VKSRNNVFMADPNTSPVNREIFVSPGETVPRAASGRPEAVADDERDDLSQNQSEESPNDVRARPAEKTDRHQPIGRF